MSPEEFWHGPGPFTTAEVAAACRCSPRYLQNRIKAGTLKVRWLGRKIRIPASAARRLALELGAEPPPRSS